MENDEKQENNTNDITFVTFHNLISSSNCFLLSAQRPQMNLLKTTNDLVKSHKWEGQKPQMGRSNATNERLKGLEKFAHSFVNKTYWQLESQLSQHVEG